MRVIITGATKGIGRAIAELFAKEGADLALCSRTLTDLESFKQELNQTYPDQEVLVQAVDMSDKAQLQQFARKISDTWESVDVLVNNAGVFLPGSLSSTDSADEDAFKTMMDTNLYSAYYFTRGILPLMLNNKSGYIFNIASIASFMPYGQYSVSKFALLGYSKVLREELKEKGIRVSAVMPGATFTNSWQGTTLPEKRFMPAEDIAKAVWSCFQLSERTVVEDIILRPQLGDI